MTSKTAAIMKAWKPTLEPLGFRVRQSMALKALGELSHIIWIQRSRWDRDKYRLNADVGIWDRFLPDPGFVVALSAHVELDGVRFAEHDAWWSDDRAPAFLEAFVRFGPAWFETMAGNPRTLLDFVERGLRENKSIKYLCEELESEANPAIAGLVKQFDGVLTVPAVYWKYASLLADVENERERACTWAKLWLAHVTRGKQLSGSPEPQRTLRQLQEMRCQEFASQ